MKVKELKELLSKMDENHEVVIPVESGTVTIGQHPSVTVEYVRQGFDWDTGKVFLSNGRNVLTTMSQETYNEHIKYKQMVSSLRGKGDINHVMFRDGVVQRLNLILANSNFEIEVLNLINDILEGEI